MHSTAAVVNLPGLVGRLTNPKPGAAFFEAVNGGSILISNVTELDRIDVTWRGNGSITLSQLKVFTGATLSLYNTTNSLPGVTNVEASNFFADQNARLTLSGVTQLIRPTLGDIRLTARNGGVLDFPNVQSAQIQDFYQLELSAESNGRVYVPHLSALQGGIIVVSDGTGSLVDISGFTGQLANTGPGAASLEVDNGGTISMPNVTQLRRVDLVIRNAGQIATAQLVALTDARLTLDSVIGNFPLLEDLTGSSITLENSAQLTLPRVTQLIRTLNGSLTLSVDGPGAVLHLPNVIAAAVLPFYQLELFARDGGQIRLPSLVSFTGAIDVIAEGTNSLVDLSSLPGALGTPAGQSSIEVSSGATVLIPNVTSLNQITLSIEGTAQIPTAQLTALTRSTVSINGAIVFFLGLSDTTGTTFLYSNQGAAVFQPPADLVLTDIQAPSSVLANRPVQMSWEVTNLGTALTNDVWSDGVYLSGDAAPGNDLFVGLVPAGGSLGAGASRRFTNTVVFPAQRAGPWHLGMVANQSHTVFEGTNFFNNTNIAAGTIQIQAPDLQVDSDQTVAENNETNNTRLASQTVTIPSVLTLQIPVTEMAENSAQIQGLVTRNGNPALPLTVTLASSDATELSVPATVTIPYGKASATFPMIAQPDGVPDPDQLVTVTASASGYLPSSAAINVKNSDAPQLMIQLAAGSVVEGGQVAGTVLRNGPTESDVDVYLNPIGHNQFILPERVTIPAGAAFVNFMLVARDDTLIEPQGFFTMSASAAGFLSASAGLLIIDNDVTQFVLSFTSTNFREGAGANAAIGTISRGTASPRSLEVELQSSNPGAVSLPARVVIASGQAEASFAVMPINNQLADGTRTAEIVAFALATLSGERVQQSAPVTLTITDDDGPALTVIPAKSLVAEGLASATTITVFLTPATNRPVTIQEWRTNPRACSGWRSVEPSQCS